MKWPMQVSSGITFHFSCEPSTTTVAIPPPPKKGSKTTVHFLLRQDSLFLWTPFLKPFFGCPSHLDNLQLTLRSRSRFQGKNQREGALGLDALHCNAHSHLQGPRLCARLLPCRNKPGPVRAHHLQDLLACKMKVRLDSLLPNAIQFEPLRSLTLNIGVSTIVGRVISELQTTSFP